MRATRRPERPSKHRKIFLRLRQDENGLYQRLVPESVAMTKPRPWQARARRRAAEKAARVARRQNRPQ